MENLRYRENKIYCGNYLDVEIYPVFRKPGKRKAKYKPTTEIQAKVNASRAEKKLERLLHTNFTEKDFALHLTYNNEHHPEESTEAQKDVQNFLRRARRLYKNNGLELKYVCVTEKGKRGGRVHHHIILSGGVDRSELEALWIKGYANTKRLQFTKNGLAGLSKYIVKQPLLFKRWSASRNLEKPTERKNDSKFSRKRVCSIFEYNYSERELERLYPGFILAEVCPELNEVNGSFYIQMRLYRKTAKILS